MSASTAGSSKTHAAHPTLDALKALGKKKAY
jgi:hypothetical protein